MRSIDIAGREFDWFAVDANGHAALFATGGCGPGPSSALAHVSAHDAVGELIPTNGWGTSAVWEDYARAGLYAYDWSESRHRYVRVAIPEVSLAELLRDAIAAIPELPRLELSFPDATAITRGWATANVR